MRERMSPRAVLRRARAQLPDVLLALQQVPQIFQTAVREAAEGRRVPVEQIGRAELRDEMRRSASRRDATIASAVLWVSGLVWLALSTQFPWLGWSQMTAAIVLFVWSRSSLSRGA
jgi:hypothetical protein